MDTRSVHRSSLQMNEAFHALNTATLRILNYDVPFWSSSSSPPPASPLQVPEVLCSIWYQTSLLRSPSGPSILIVSCDFLSLFPFWRPSSHRSLRPRFRRCFVGVSRSVILHARSALTQIHSLPLFALQCLMACDKGRLNGNIEVRSWSEVTT